MGTSQITFATRCRPTRAYPIRKSGARGWQIERKSHSLNGLALLACLLVLPGHTTKQGLVCHAEHGQCAQVQVGQRLSSDSFLQTPGGGRATPFRAVSESRVGNMGRPRTPVP